ncbi:MAG: Fe-coproporphyrin synthase [Euryarchaeota archaeon]|jgi:radical SAM protein with 4Fe4S-binding SPASM domain|nr:Fe-coproporphyrin synthase [Euryarchaeota archaeon]MDN5339990.1 Fe-coproporphyrin synthase [Euryarchaeota archaeon]
MNRITQCMHGRGTVSSVMRHRERPLSEVPGKYLAFVQDYRPVVFWNLTDRCNLACAHCYSRSGPGSRTDEELSTTEALVLIDDLAAAGVPLILFSGGEPLLREDLPELARAAADHGIRTALSTNGTLITPDAARMIKDAGIGYAGISLDGASPETHDAFRGSEGAFARAVEGFARCREAGIRTGLRVTLTRENMEELEALIDLAVTLGASRFCLYWLVPSGRGSEAYDRLQVGSEEVDEALTLLYRRALETDPGAMEFLTVDAPQDCIHLLRAMERDGSPDLAGAEALVRSLNGGCSAGKRVANIDPRGNVYPCQFARSPEFLVGNVRDRPFSRIWQDAENPVLSWFRSEPRALFGKCGRCGYRDLCGGGCRVRAYAAGGDFSAEDPFCFVEE